MLFQVGGPSLFAESFYRAVAWDFGLAETGASQKLQT
jgi:hypothetical protein